MASTPIKSWKMQNDTSEYLIDDDESVNDIINIYNFSAFFFQQRGQSHRRHLDHRFSRPNAIADQKPFPPRRKGIRYWERRFDKAINCTWKWIFSTFVIQFVLTRFIEFGPRSPSPIAMDRLQPIFTNHTKNHSIQRWKVSEANR